MSNLYFISDQHFGHINIQKYAQRPFEHDFEGMISCAKFMYETYQQIVQEDDIVLFLGDVAFFNRQNSSEFKKMLRTLKGKKLMLIGNHDSMTKKFYKDCGFLDIRDFHIVGKHFICHYPIQQTRTPKEKLCEKAFQESECTEIWHGHIHEKEPNVNDGIKRHNMCVDYAPNGYKPILILDKEIKNYFEEFVKEL